MFRVISLLVAFSYHLTWACPTFTVKSFLCGKNQSTQTTRTIVVEESLPSQLGYLFVIAGEAPIYVKVPLEAKSSVCYKDDLQEYWVVNPNLLKSMSSDYFRVSFNFKSLEIGTDQDLWFCKSSSE